MVDIFVGTGCRSITDFAEESGGVVVVVCGFDLFVFFVVRFDVLDAVLFVVIEFVNIVNISVVVFIGSDFFNDEILRIKFVFDSNSGIISVAEFDKGSERDVFNVVGVGIDVVESFFVGDKVVGV